MEIAFKSVRLRDVCENEKTAKEVLGEDIAGALKKRLADIRAAVSLSDLPSSPIYDRGTGEVSVPLTGTYQAFFKPNHVSKNQSSDDTPDWHKISRIKVVRIQNGIVVE